MGGCNLAVLASGEGTNFQAIADHVAAGVLRNVNLRVLVYNRPEAKVKDRAEKCQVPSEFVSHAGKDRGEFDEEVIDTLNRYGVDLIALAGWDRILGAEFIEKYRWKILNIHPSLLPFAGGKGMYGRKVHKAVLESGVKVTGPTVHYVDIAVDRGPIIDQYPVHIGDIYGLPIAWEDKITLLAERVLLYEHRLYSRVIQLQADGRIKIETEKVEREGMTWELTIAVPDYSGNWLKEWNERQRKFLALQNEK
ncbi:phosphoribosylglycinamide formyltransferase [Candidatus Hecatella orcuttiae]|jgi:phosphoribosylglycinamide formyltransferase-1|uniref:phosphoribosylglycinamide formyltransferase n=1 Tax=Candidatus Hecatella orcuttiae TaxID=1935119 RepID=UPI00286812C0|nr:phosphoribosylglycinamide formyltransferase [Candidatus Hecatella orcuttiae]